MKLAKTFTFKSKRIPRDKSETTNQRKIDKSTLSLFPPPQKTKTNTKTQITAHKVTHNFKFKRHETHLKLVVNQCSSAWLTVPALLVSVSFCFRQDTNVVTKSKITKISKSHLSNDNIKS